MECFYFFKNSFVKRLSLSSYSRDAHKLHIFNLAETLLYKRKIARKTNRDAEGDETGDEAVAGAAAPAHGSGEPPDVSRALGMKGESNRAGREPRFRRAFGVKAH